MRLISAKDVKVNNFINMRPPPKTSRSTRTALKKKSTKPQTNTLNPSQQLLLQKSDKMKLIFWNQEPSLQYLTPVILSADFIVNQDNFWEKLDESKTVEQKQYKMEGSAEKQQSAMVKEWRHLHKKYFVIWVVRSRMAWTKVQHSI